MKFLKRNRMSANWLIYPALVGAIAILPFSLGQADEHRKYRVPFKYAVGKGQFEKLCSSCHGKWAIGTDKGPPLLHNFYKPSHHGDRSFYNAVKNGAKQHHWRFGDMQPLPNVAPKTVGRIIEYVRWLQEENGIRN